jgi:hypothetical protein
VVTHVDLELYSDEAGKKLIPDGVAIVLEARAPAGHPGGTYVFPTTRKKYQPGQRVAWEWNPAKGFDEAWYRDPVSGEIKHAWSSAMEFSGRPLDEL